MRAIVLLLCLALAGCVESESSVEIGQEHDHCHFFCDTESHVHFDWFPVVLFVGVIAVIGIVIAVAAGSGGQSQQQVVVVRKDR